MTIQDDLTAHIASAYEADAEWGRSDCTPFAGRWVEIRTGAAIDWPVSWRSQDEAMAIIARAGSLDRLWADYLSGAAMRHGLRETGMPAYGDIGVVDTGRIGQVGGIFLDGGYFVWRIRRGVMMIRPRDFVRAWTFSR